MSLQVWLPLNGDTQNYGLDREVTLYQNTGAAINANGKIGSCYTFNGSSHWMQWNIDKTKYANKPISYALWIKCGTSKASGSVLDLAADLVLAYSYTSSTVKFSYWRCYTNGSGNRAGRSNTTTTSYDASKWHHVVITFNGPINKIYVDGILSQTFDDSSYYTNIWTPLLGGGYVKFSVGKSAGDSYWSDVSVNDVRIYDHCLSEKEVKEIAKGLVLHYKLDRNAGVGLNLLKNGFGELGNQYWGAAGDTTDIPSGQNDIKASFPPCGNTAAIPITRNTTYKMSAWIKSSATSGNTYPSLYPYDIDNKFIANQNSRVGFNLNTMTTIAQTLNPGDTKIYVASLANWNANSGTYYNYAAIFSYQDSTGHIYPDGTYTQNIPRFGSGTTAKTNLDKTNNIITLSAAYTGPIIPVGTKVCAATDGSTYFYPLGGISCASVPNWTYKESTFSSEDGRLLAATTVKFHIYSNSRMAGIRIINQNTLENQIYDVSGYQHNATPIGNVNVIKDTPRYDAATAMNNTGTSNHIQADPLSGLSDNIFTVSFWIKAVKSTNQVFFADPKVVIGTLNSLIYPFISSASGFSTTHFINNEWNHIVVVRNNTSYQVYVNGEAETQNGANNNYLHGAAQLWLLNRSNNNSYAANTTMSDVRVYCTALSADDVKELYNTSASIDNKGNIYVREVIEI